MKNPFYRYLRLYIMEAWYSYRALFAWQRLEPYLSVKFVFPFFLLLLFVFMGRFAGIQDPLYIVIGNILLLPSINGVMGVSMTIGNERLFGTLTYLLGSPAPRAPLFLGRTLFHILDGFSTVVITLPIAVLVFRLDLSQANWLLLASCVLLLTLSSSGLGMILGSISLLSREGWFITSTIAMALYILCGVNFPVSMLPAALKWIAYGLPMTRGIMAAREALSGASWASVAPLMLSEALVGLIYAVLGYALFLILEKLSLTSGQMDAI